MQIFALVVLLLAPLSGMAKELIVWGTPNDRGLKAALRQFEVEHPGWEVVTSAGSSGGMDPQKLMCGIAGGSPPDMLQQDRFSVGEWAVRDAFISLDEYVEQSVREEEQARVVLAALQRGDRTAAARALADLRAALEKRGPSKQADTARQLQATIESGSASPEQAEALLDLVQGIHPETFFNACWQEASFESETSGAYTPFPTAPTTARSILMKTSWNELDWSMPRGGLNRRKTGRSSKNTPSA